MEVMLEEEVELVDIELHFQEDQNLNFYYFIWWIILSNYNWRWWSWRRTTSYWRIWNFKLIHHFYIFNNYIYRWRREVVAGNPGPASGNGG
jgi:hypothetical protein